MENIYLDKTKMKIKTLKMGMKTVLQWHKEGQKIVFTNGCFDLVHRGHIEYLSRAASLGDRLVVGLNSDTSVRRLKGENRPVKDQESRVLLIASFYWVDCVIIFDEETPLKLIEGLMPDVLVKGGDYQIDEIIGADSVIENGGTVEKLDFIEGYSTSKLIDKIKRENDDN